MPLFVVALDTPDGQLTLDLRWTRRQVKGLGAAELHAALDGMAALEDGAISNPDEDRMVGHYWLRAPQLAPNAKLSQQITTVSEYVQLLVDRLDGRFEHVLHLGVGGSALGPQLISSALGSRWDARRLHFIDNTDPDGIARLLDGLPLDETLVVVVSKSGTTPETRNALTLVEAALADVRLSLPERAIAITGDDSALWRRAQAEGWLGLCPMWDWVGGRTSVTSAVGLVPMLLQGLDVEAFLAGAAEMDRATRNGDTNPAIVLAQAWWVQAKNRSRPTMVVMPYSDRLALLASYLQQLLMESLGKQGEGLAVYGNKGSTDQHAYVQQLRDGRPDFFVAFVEVLTDGGSTLEVEPGVTAGDYLSGFLAGTRQALHDAGRDSLTVSVERVDEYHLGALVALFERAVGYYASFIGINAYHQPGVEAGKKAAARVLDLQRGLLEHLAGGASGTAEAIAAEVGADAADVFHILRRLAANGRVSAVGSALDQRFSALERRSGKRTEQAPGPRQ